LPELYRLPFVLCHFEGRSGAAIARELGCPVGTVDARLSRARQRLRHGLARRGVVLSAGLLTATLARGAAEAAGPAPPPGPAPPVGAAARPGGVRQATKGVRPAGSPTGLPAAVPRVLARGAAGAGRASRAAAEPVARPAEEPGKAKADKPKADKPKDDKDA